MALYIGLMSGTSMDGIDAALVEINNHHTKLLATHSAPIPRELKQTLQTFYTDTLFSIRQMGEADIELGRLFAKAVNELIKQTGISPSEVQAIGSHGQTIFHAPEGEKPFTLQIGDPNTITELTGITTVADFRRRDMAAGGQGAPLVPAFHDAAFRSAEKNQVILNIGGIANITILPKDSSLTASGFDTGPGNALLDAWSLLHLNQPIDMDAQWAQKGQVNHELLTRMLADPYFVAPPPKSTGKELFNINWLRQHTQSEPPEEVQRTLAELTIETISQAIETHASDTDEIYVCGGGARNPLLMDGLNKRLPKQKIDTTEALGIAPDWVEAVAFAWLAKQCIDHKPANLPSATGAKQHVILGGIYPGRTT